jgi:hypothetical protein
VTAIKMSLAKHKKVTAAIIASAKDAADTRGAASKGSTLKH